MSGPPEVGDTQPALVANDEYYQARERYYVALEDLIEATTALSGSDGELLGLLHHMLIRHLNTRLPAPIIRLRPDNPRGGGAA